MKVRITITAIILATIGFANIASAQLPDPGVTIVEGRTALLITDPQNDFLSPKGVTWGRCWQERHRKQYRREYRLPVRSSQSQRHSGICLAALLLPDRPRLAV